MLRSISVESYKADIETSNRLHPTNRTDINTLNQTEAKINDITQPSKAFVYRSHTFTGIFFWVVPVTESQLGELQKLDGLKAIEENRLVGTKAAAVPVAEAIVELPEEAFHKNAKRAEQYATQTSPGTDLRFASQPT